MLKKFHEVRKKSERSRRTCMYKSCNEIAIKSHVLQKNGILNSISTNGHLIEHVPPNPFEMMEKGISDFKLIGLNKVYTFSGFCSKHDTDVFKPIETENKLDFCEPNQQALFCYRGLCQEIRRKEISKEWLNGMRDFFPKHNLYLLDSLLDGYSFGIQNLNHFKSELEECIESDNYDSYYFETIKIPFIELCISVSLNVGDLKLPKDNDYDKWKEKREMPFATSFINVFPKGNISYVIIGYHKDYPCNWTKEFASRLKSISNEEIKKELSDLIVLRLEFWAMSKKLFETIDEKDIEEFKRLEIKNVFNHSPSMETKLNLFKKI